MSWLSSALTSSVGRKWVMGLTGFFLIGFTLIHLAGNLLLYVGDGAYNHYAHSLHANPSLVLVAEIILLILFGAHIVLGFQLTIANRRARPEAYEMRRSKQGNTKATPSATMYVTGALVLGFILLHLADFRFHLHNPGPEGEEPFVKALRLLQDPITASVYFLGSLLLGWHLWHGFQSAFQSLGLRHPKYTPFIRKFGVALAILLGLGFASFPVWAYLKKFGVLP
ncbi:MAG TPA: succinate dehydrogenase cytochrome b subunit [bacterium]|nr:succinate dehydrogenase cytochrome b subunit [bacterium]